MHATVFNNESDVEATNMPPECMRSMTSAWAGGGWKRVWVCGHSI